MSADGDIVRDLANVPTDHHDRCNSRDGRECDCYMLYWQPLLAALARLEAAALDPWLTQELEARAAAAEAQRDALAEALREITAGKRPSSHEDVARAALAEAGLE